MLSLSSKLLCLSLALTASVASAMDTPDQICKKQAGPAAYAWDNTADGSADGFHCVVPVQWNLGCNGGEVAANPTNNRYGWGCYPAYGVPTQPGPVVANPPYEQPPARVSWSCRCYDNGMWRGMSAVTFDISANATTADMLERGAAKCRKLFGYSANSAAGKRVSTAADFCQRI